MAGRAFETLNRSGRGACAAALALCLLVACLLPSPAAAQQQYQRRSILEFFFGRQTPPEAEAPRRQRSIRHIRRASAPAAKPAVIAPDEPAPAEKLAGAKTVLVVGDFLANGLGDGLQQAFASSPGVVIQTRSNIASGLVRDDYYDWFAQLPKMLDTTKPALVVVMLGGNDRQQMSAPGLSEKFGTDTWFLAYEERVQSFARLVTNRNIPLVWVGLPPFASEDMTADIVKLNQLYQSQTTGVSATFVDIWGGFTDEAGKFIVTGSDVNGQQVRLRTADGVNMTDAGRRKMAFYAEKPIRRLLGDQASPDIVRLDSSAPTDPAALPHAEPAEQTDRTVPISFSDPDLDGGTALLGNNPLPPTAAASPRDLLVEKGQIAPPPVGRVDDYRLPDKTPRP